MIRFLSVRRALLFLREYGVFQFLSRIDSPQECSHMTSPQSLTLQLVYFPFREANNLLQLLSLTLPKHFEQWSQQFFPSWDYMMCGIAFISFPQYILHKSVHTQLPLSLLRGISCDFHPMNGSGNTLHLLCLQLGKNLRARYLAKCFDVRSSWSEKSSISMHTVRGLI